MSILNLDIDYSRYHGHENYDPDLWAKLYENHDRYLEDASLTELEERYKTILRNKITLVSPKQDLFPVHNIFLSSWFWLRKEVETEMEFNLREKLIPEVDLSQYREFLRIDPPIIKAQNNFEHVVRFGRLSWLKDMLIDGRIQIKHASRYLDDDMNYAQKDDELRSYSYSSSKNVKIIGSNQQNLKPIGKITDIKKLDLDCYMLCSSKEIDPLLFYDFNYDGCLLIKNVDEFARRMESAWNTKFKGWHFTYNPIYYFDEFNVNPIILKNDDSLINVPRSPVMSKSFRFAYQKEYRFWWVDLKMSLGEKSLGDYVELNLGSLEDIAEIYSLSELRKAT